MTRDSPPKPAPLSPRAVREELRSLDRGARKALGQHFLTNRHVAERIVRTAALQPTDTVVEIGPGLGALSDELADAAGTLWLVELDHELGARARARFADRDNVHVLVEDALRVDFRALLGADTRALLVANLPYNVATEILLRHLEPPTAFGKMVVMIQLEVAQRLAAAPGGKTYGVLSVMAQLVARTRIAFRVPPSAFTPPPKVESAVIEIEPLAEPPVAIRRRDVFKQVVRTAFGQRRKHLSNSLRPLAPDIADRLRDVGIDPTRRPETLSLAEFAAIADRIPDPSETRS